MNRIVTIAALIVLAAAACGRNNTADIERSSGQVLTNALCQARTDAARGDSDAANREYYDHAHQPLHELASQLQAKDRRAAAALLEAHQRVEDDLAMKPTPPELADHIGDLAAQTRDAVFATGKPRPQPCPT